MTLYTKPVGFCLNCKKTIVQLKMHHIPYKVAKAKPEVLKKYGYVAYPVVCPTDKLNDTKNNWDSFNMPKIANYIKLYKK